MAIEKYLKPSDIFDPLPTYEGDLVFSINDNFRRNAIVEENNNLLLAFMEEEYNKPLLEIFKTKRILDFPVKFFSTVNENKFGRSLYFSKVDFFVEMTMFLNQNIDRYGKKPEEHREYLIKLTENIKQSNDVLNSIYSEEMKKKAEKIKDVMEKEFNSIYFEEAMKDYAPYKNKLDFSTYIKNLYNITVNFQNGLLSLGDFFDKKIDYDKLASCFEPDKFYLLFTRLILDTCYQREKEVGRVDNSYSYLHKYKMEMEKVVEEDKKYNPHVFVTLPSGKKTRYNRWQFLEEFKVLMARHPEAKMIQLPDLGDDINKLKDPAIINKLSEIYSEESKVNWEFLPAGTTIKKVEHKRQNPGKSEGNIDYSKLIEETNMRIDIINASGYIGTPIKGLDTFSGYYAFIYPNGKVILEKFWENYEKQIPATGCATYVMNIDNFVEMSKISKINLIEYIKTFPESGIKRIFHTSINNWQRCLNDEINGTYRLEDALNFIKDLKTGGLKNE